MIEKNFVAGGMKKYFFDPGDTDWDIEVQIIKYTRLEGELRVRRTFFVRRREVRLITPCHYLYELL